MRSTPALLCTVLFGSAAYAQPVFTPSDPLWEAALTAYGEGRTEEGHISLRTLLERSPGDMDLAVACLDRIRTVAGRINFDDPWVRYASERLMALERLGAISANSRTARENFAASVEIGMSDGHRLEVIEELDRVAEKNPHDIHWKITRAEGYRRVDSVKTLPIYEALRAEKDLDHPDVMKRDHWHRIDKELGVDNDQLPKPLEPPPDGNPLPLLEPDDPDGLWGDAQARTPRKIAPLIDRLASQSLAEDQIVPWRDMSGLIDPPRAVDLYLRSLPEAEVAPLRKFQAAQMRIEDVRDAPTTSEVLALYRRYAWALPAQRLLLTNANEALWAGFTHSALRSFRDLLDHAIDEKLRDDVTVGHWIALAQAGETAAFDAAIASVDPDRVFSWLGKPTTAKEIRERLLIAPVRAADDEAPSLADLETRVVRIPSAAPWPAESPSDAMSLDLRLDGDDLFVSARNLIALYDAKSPAAPRWTRVQRHHIEEKKPRGHYPGYFRPTLAGPIFYARHGFTSTPNGVAAFDRATGRPIWSNEPDSPSRSRGRRPELHIPMGDPVLASGLLYYLEWNVFDNVHQSRGRQLGLVCYDPRRRERLWGSTIVEAGLSSDITARFERAPPEPAIYGNRVTIHDGEIYACSNAGIVARCDPRDGRADWIHFYRKGRGSSGARVLGTAPIVAGNNVIFLPRDAGRVFALDRRTGRVVWDNVLVLAQECLGVVDATLVIRGQGSVAALDLESGRVRWHLPLPRPSLSRGQLIGSSVYVGLDDGLRRIDVRTGRIVETRDWGLDRRRPVAFRVREGELFVVTDEPADDVRQPLGESLSSKVKSDASPIDGPVSRAWSIHRESALLSMPPKGSPLDGRAFLLAGGVLESIEVSASGAIQWRRFVDTRGPSIHFVDRSLLVVAPALSGSRTRSRVVSVDGESGNSLWTRQVPLQVAEVLACGPIAVFHDRKGAVFAVDASTGERLWERRVGNGHLRVSWEDGSVHVITVSQEREPHHLRLDPTNGQERASYRIELTERKNASMHGRLVAGGYYEITFDPVEARHVRLVALSEINGRGWASIAELHLIGEDGKNLPRERWTTSTDSYEKNSRYDTRPLTAIDGDPVTWWHSQWLGGIPPHPHWVQVDLGQPTKIRGLRYLPAVIVNNNGMIRDYEFYVSSDAQAWDEPVAAGVLVQRVRIDRPLLAQGGFFFDSLSPRTRKHGVYRYELHGAPARLVYESARLVTSSGPWVVINAREKEGAEERCIVLSARDPEYRFDLAASGHIGNGSEVAIDGDLLVLARNKLLVANLPEKRMIVPLAKDGELQNKHGVVLLVGSTRVLKIVRTGRREGHSAFLFDLEDGKRTDFLLAGETEHFQDRTRRHERWPLWSFDDVLLTYDGSTISAWVDAGDAAGG